MRNVSKKLMNSWYDLLAGNLANLLPVYVEAVPETEQGNYVLLRSEGETDVDKNDKTWIKEVVIIADITTVFTTDVDPDVADNIDQEIGLLVAVGPGHNHNLSAQDDMKINSVTAETSTNLQEDDGEKKYYRKITRYNHLITIQS